VSLLTDPPGPRFCWTEPSGAHAYRLAVRATDPLLRLTLRAPDTGTCR
jgi:hypothetical protein